MLSTVFTNDIRQTLDQFRRSVDHLFDNFYGYPTDRPATGSSERNEWAFSPMLETGWDDNYPASPRDSSGRLPGRCECVDARQSARHCW